MDADRRADVARGREGVGQRALGEQRVVVGLQLLLAERFLEVADGDEDVVPRAERDGRIVDRRRGGGDVVLEREFEGLAEREVALDPGPAHGDVVAERLAETGLAHACGAEVKIQAAADAQGGRLVWEPQRDALVVDRQRLAIETGSARDGR